jgi:PAS domain S-box-containing protein
VRSDFSRHYLSDPIPSGHICGLYKTEEERRSMTANFVHQGLESGEKVLYIKDRSEDEDILADLASDGLPVETYLRQGQLRLLSSEEAYLEGDLFDPDRMVSMLQEETERALAGGYTALRVCGGAAWALQDRPDAERLVEYEYKVNAFLSSNQCRALCHYDLNAHDPRVLLAIMAQHPVLLLGTEWLENVHFDFAKNPITYDLPQWILQRQIEDLLEHKRAEQKLKESEFAYRTLAENLPGIVYRVFLQENNRTHFYNKNAQDVTGYRLEELIPGEVCKIDPLILPDERQGVIAEVTSAIQGQRPFSLAYRLRHKDGGIRYVLEQGVPVYAQDGTPLFIDGVIFDITEQKWAEEALRLQAQIIDQIHDSVVSTDLDGYVTSWNKGAERMFGYRVEEAVGKHISFVYREDQYDFLENQVIAPLKKKGVHEVELEMVNKTGKNFYAHLSLSLLRDHTNTVTGMIGYTKDITAQVEAQAELKARAQQQAVIVKLGQRALEGVDLYELMDEAVSVVASTLDVELCKILELSGDGESLLLRAGVGWQDGIVGHTLLDAGEGSQAGYTLQSNEPVVVENLHQEQRFDAPKLLLDHDVISGISTPIRENKRPFGVLGAHTTRKRNFSVDDINFIQAVANVLAGAINRKRYEEALKESELRFRTQYKATPVATYTWRNTGQDFELIDYNDAAEEFTNGHIVEFLGRSVTDMYAHAPDVLEDFKRCFNEQQAIKREMVYRSLISGKVGRFSVNYVYIPPDLVMVHTEDITERKRKEEERSRLLAIERQARHSAEAMREATAALSVTLDFPQVMDAILVNLKKVVPYSHACLVLEQDTALRVMACKGFPDSSVIVDKEYPRDDEEFYSEIRRSAGPLVLSDAQEISRRKCCRGEGVARSWIGVPFVVTGKIIGFLSIDSHLPNAYGQTEAALAQTFANQAAVVIENARLFEQVNTGRERLRLLTKKVVDVQEQERQRVSRELHDEIGQTLTAVKLSIQALQHQESPIEMAPRLVDTIKIIEQALQQVRRLSLDLRPTLLDDLGLVATLRWYVDRQAKWGGFESKFTARPLEMRLPWELETTCFRIVQEALTNAMRHAHPQNVHIELLLDDDVLKLNIQDDGVGFDVASAFERAASGFSMGLLGMQERVSLMGGELSIKSLRGEGTIVRAIFPVYWMQRINHREEK